MRIIIILLLAALSFSSHAAGPRLSKVPGEKLQGNRLVSTADNFSITAPDKSWQWYEFRKSAIVYGYLLVHRGTNERYLVTINSKTYPPINDKVAKVYLGNIAKSYNASGGKVTNQKYQLSDSPIPGSYRITYNNETPNGKILRTYTQLFSNKKLYMISYSTENPEPEVEKKFYDFVASFKPLK